MGSAWKTAEPVGIKGTYPRVPLPLRARAWVAACRPFTLLAPILGVLLAGAAAAAQGAAPHDYLRGTGHLVLGVLTLGLATIGGNLLNQAEDVVADRVNRPFRPVPRGLITPEAALLGAFLCWVLSLAAALALGAVEAGLVAFIILLSIAYSARPVRLKRIPWLGNIGVATARGFLGWVAAWAIWAPITPTTLTMGGILAVFLVGAITAKDFTDAPGDAKENVRTLVVTYGAEGAAWRSVPFVMSPILLLPLATAAGLVHVSLAWASLAMLACAILAWQMLTNPLKPNRVLEGSRVWAWHYVTLLLLMVTFASRYLTPW